MLMPDARPQAAPKNDQSIGRMLDFMRAQQMRGEKASAPISLPVGALRRIDPQGQKSSAPPLPSPKSSSPLPTRSGLRPLADRGPSAPDQFSDSRDTPSGSSSMTDSRNDALDSVGGQEDPYFPAMPTAAETGQEGTDAGHETTAQKAQKLRQSEGEMNRRRDQAIGGPTSAQGDAGDQPQEQQEAQRAASLQRARMEDDWQSQDASDAAPADEADQTDAEDEAAPMPKMQKMLRDTADAAAIASGFGTAGFTALGGVASMNMRYAAGKYFKTGFLAKLFPPLSRPQKLALIPLNCCACLLVGFVFVIFIGGFIYVINYFKILVWLIE